MTLDDLRRLDEAYRKAKPRLFQLSISDPPATEADIVEAERLTGVTLPDDYRSFLKEFGGGCYGLTVIFSACPQSQWYLPNQLLRLRNSVPTGWIAFSDDFAGGEYVLQVRSGKALGPVIYHNGSDGMVGTDFASVIDYIARYAYTPA